MVWYFDLVAGTYLVGGTFSSSRSRSVIRLAVEFDSISPDPCLPQGPGYSFTDEPARPGSHPSFRFFDLPFPRLSVSRAVSRLNSLSLSLPLSLLLPRKVRFIHSKGGSFKKPTHGTRKQDYYKDGQAWPHCRSLSCGYLGRGEEDC